MGGEKRTGKGEKGEAAGSPPRGRGKEHAAPAGHTAAGITPAWAGKRSARLLWRLTIGDHPRMGGEKVFDDAYIDFYYGSPPHGRGKGFSMMRTSTFTMDHPRVGGEKFVDESHFYKNRAKRCA